MEREEILPSDKMYNSGDEVDRGRLTLNPHRLEVRATSVDHGALFPKLLGFVNYLRTDHKWPSDWCEI
jgi:hypothetical protein